jgi:hypothetical protein
MVNSTSLFGISRSILTGVAALICGAPLLWVMAHLSLRQAGFAHGLADSSPGFTTTGIPPTGIPFIQRWDEGLWIEAETAQGSGSRWAPKSSADASGEIAAAGIASSGSPAFSLNYPVFFADPGDYYLHIRAKSDADLRNPKKIWVNFDGQAGTAEALTGFTLGFGWNRGETAPYVSIPIHVSHAGLHHISLLAESGLVVDLLYLTTDPSVRPGARQPRTAHDFTSSVGINTHLAYHDTAYGDFAKIESALAYSGIRHVRDGLSQLPEVQRRIDKLGADGYAFDFFLMREDPLEHQLAAMRERPRYIAAIEGPNEVDNWPVHHGGRTGLVAARAMMADLRRAIATDPKLAALPIIQTSFGKQQTYQEMGDLGAFADYANAHSYFSWGDPPGGSFIDRAREAQIVSPAKPVISTEAGYHTAIGSQQWNSGLSEHLHARYIVRLLLEQFAGGVTRTYLYELLDVLPDPAHKEPDRNFGLFHGDGSPKPAAVALHHLLGLLKDKDSSFVPTPLDYVVEGAPPHLGNLLLQKSDGSSYLVLWNDVPGWDHEHVRERVVLPAPVTLRFALPLAEAITYDLETGSASSPPIDRDRHITLAIGDMPTLLRVTLSADDQRR